MSGGKLVPGGWAHLKRPDCHQTARLIIDILLELELGVAVIRCSTGCTRIPTGAEETERSGHQ